MYKYNLELIEVFIKFCEKRIVSMESLSILIAEYVKSQKTTISTHNLLVCL